MRSRAISTVIGVAAAAVAAMAVPAAASAGACTPRFNIEAIMDDSSSMLDNDPQGLRRQAMKLFINTPANAQKQLGMTEFSGEARGLFGPQPIAPNRASMVATIDAEINSDGTTGTSTGTDYNDAFTTASSHNPNADARIFLTDGAHLESAAAGPYTDTHRGGPPTYVIGFGDSTSGPDGERLARIAAETGGQYFPATDNTTLQENIGKISAVLNCQDPPKTFKDEFDSSGEKKKHAVGVRAGTDSVTLILSWLDDEDSFSIGKIQLRRNGDVVADTTKKTKPSKRLELERATGDTFVTAEISNLRRGKLSFQINAQSIFSFGPTVTTQASQGPG